MKIKVDMMVVVDKTMEKFPVDIYECNFKFKKENSVFVTNKCRITMPNYFWEYLIQEYLLMFGFDDTEKSSLKILEKEKPNDDNGFNSTTVLVEIDGWTIPGIKFMENK